MTWAVDDLMGARSRAGAGSRVRRAGGDAGLLLTHRSNRPESSRETGAGLPS
jgi:hypothetical protein